MAAAFDNADRFEGLAPPVVVGRLLDRAVAVGASDFFLSAQDGEWDVSLRHNGIVQAVARLSLELGRHCAAHLKAEAGMDIEHFHPHDGRLAHAAQNGKIIDVRICSLPTLHGETLALRLLDRTSRLLGLAQIGLSPEAHDRLERLLQAPGGLLLFTGPTGAGKSTTLYACLQHLNDGLRRINTIEDPIEYAIPGMQQSQINVKQGLGFPELLRAIVRQGPDVIMIGEIRDPETAKTAVYAANSGHLVLATLHASLAAGSVQSMLAFDVSPHFLASSLLGAVSQRLIRTFCPHCRFPIEAEDEAARNNDGVRERRYSALGCPTCHQTGFMGRTGVFEILEASPGIRNLIQAREPAPVIEALAYREGMPGLHQAARELVAAGRTEWSEVARVLPLESRNGDTATGNSGSGAQRNGE